MEIKYSFNFKDVVAAFIKSDNWLSLMAEFESKGFVYDTDELIKYIDSITFLKFARLPLSCVSNIDFFGDESYTLQDNRYKNLRVFIYKRRPNNSLKFKLEFDYLSNYFKNHIKLIESIKEGSFSSFFTYKKYYHSYFVTSKNIEFVTVDMYFLLNKDESSTVFNYAIKQFNSLKTSFNQYRNCNAKEIDKSLEEKFHLEWNGCSTAESGQTYSIPYTDFLIQQLISQFDEFHTALRISNLITNNNSNENIMDFIDDEFNLIICNAKDYIKNYPELLKLFINKYEAIEPDFIEEQLELFQNIIYDLENSEASHDGFLQSEKVLFNRVFLYLNSNSYKKLNYSLNRKIEFLRRKVININEDLLETKSIEAKVSEEYSFKKTKFENEFFYQATSLIFKIDKDANLNFNDKLCVIQSLSYKMQNEIVENITLQSDIIKQPYLNRIENRFNNARNWITDCSMNLKFHLEDCHIENDKQNSWTASKLYLMFNHEFIEYFTQLEYLLKAEAKGIISDIESWEKPLVDNMNGIKSTVDQSANIISSEQSFTETSNVNKYSPYSIEKLKSKNSEKISQHLDSIEDCFSDITEFEIFKIALINFFSNENYNLPTVIKTKVSTKTRLSKVFNPIYKDLGTIKLKENTEFLNIVRVIDKFKDSDVYRDITRY